MNPKFKIGDVIFNLNFHDEKSTYEVHKVDKYGYECFKLDSRNDRDNRHDITFETAHKHYASTKAAKNFIDSIFKEQE